MTTAKDIIDIIEAFAPPTLAENWDNSGLAVGDTSVEVKKVLTALDCDESVVLEAVKKGCNMIVCHHPLIFRPLGFVTTENPVGKTVLTAAKHDIVIYSAHTNLDCATGGINDYLCNLLGLENVTVCTNIGEGNLVRTGEIVPCSFGGYAKTVAEKLGKKYIRCVGAKDKIIRRVGICSGGGGDYISEMADKCDLYITGDVKYHMARNAAESGLCVAIAEHFETEHFTKEIFREILSKQGITAVCSEINLDVTYDIFT